MRLRGSRRNNPRKLNAFTLCSVHAGRTVDERNIVQGEALRLRPEMSSRRLLVLTFVRGYIGRHGGSPSIGEIAAGCSISRPRAREHVKGLVRAGLVLKRAGPRGLSLPGERAEAIRHLRDLGWWVDEAGNRATFPDSTLPAIAALDYVPPSERVDDGIEQAGQGTGRD